MTAADLATGPEGGTLDAVLGRLNALDVLVHSGIRVTAGPDGAVVARVADPGPEHVEQRVPVGARLDPFEQLDHAQIPMSVKRMTLIRMTSNIMSYCTMSRTLGT